MAAAVTPPSPGDAREPPTAHRRGPWVLLVVAATVLAVASVLRDRTRIPTAGVATVGDATP